MTYGIFIILQNKHSDISECKKNLEKETKDMSRYFEVADKILEGKVVGKWDVLDEHLPKYSTANSAGADFCAVEDTIIPSIWKQVLSCISKSGQSVFKWVGELAKNGGKSEICLSDEIKEIKADAFKPTLVHTGIKAKFKDNEVLKVYNRSSGPNRGLVLSNSVGVVDADYYGNESNDGEIMLSFYNFMPFDVEVKKGDRIGQGVFEKILKASKAINKDGEEVEVETDVKRTGGYGSTN